MSWAIGWRDRLDRNNALRRSAPAGFEPSVLRLKRTIGPAFRAQVLIFGFALILGVVTVASPAAAQCFQSGTVETCTGDLPGPRNFNTSSGVNDLEINSVTTGPSQGSLQGVGTASGAGTPATS